MTISFTRWNLLKGVSVPLDVSRRNIPYWNGGGGGFKFCGDRELWYRVVLYFRGRWLSSGTLRRVVWQILTNVSDVLIVSVIRAMSGVSKCLWNMWQYLQHYTEQHSRRQPSSSLQEPEISPATRCDNGRAEYIILTVVNTANSAVYFPSKIYCKFYVYRKFVLVVNVHTA
jgi:hypothetical protein